MQAQSSDLLPNDRAPRRGRAGANDPLARLARELGARVEEAWSERGPGALAAVASDTLRKEPRFDGRLDELLAIALRADRSMHASSDAFSDLGVTLAVTSRLVVEALVWIDASTAVHDHAFAGAFRVLDGESLHATFRYREGSRLAPGLRLGTLRRAAVEWLCRGAVRPIPRGERFVHSVVHVARPSVTLVVRERAPARKEQWNYLAPGLAYDPFQAAERAWAALRCARAASELTGIDGAKQFLKQLPKPDRLVAFEIARASWSRPGAATLLEPWTPPRATERVRRALDTDLGQRTLIAARRHVRSQSGRLLLGLLSVSTNREELLAAVRAVLGAGADATSWVIDALGDVVLDWPVLDVPLVDRASLDALHRVITTAAGGEKSLRTRFGRVFDRASLARHGEALRAYAQALSTHPALGMTVR